MDDAKPDTTIKLRVQGGTREDFVESLEEVRRGRPNVDESIWFSVSRPPGHETIVAMFKGHDFLPGTVVFRQHGYIRARPLLRGILELSLDVVKPDSKPAVLEYWAHIIEALKADGWELVETSEAPIEAPRGNTRRGPSPRPDEEKRRIVQGWYGARARGTTQPAYCATLSISVSTLRDYIKELEAKGEK
jgi:hypothetical protein